MMTDADKGNGNGPRAGGHQWPPTPDARRRHYMAAHVSRAAPPQLPVVLLGSARFAHRHMDAADCDELVCVPNHKLKISARCSIGGRIRSEEHTSELQSRGHLVCRLLLEK